MNLPNYINLHSHGIPSGVFETPYYGSEPSWQHALARVAARLLDQVVADMGLTMSVQSAQQDS